MLINEKKSYSKVRKDVSLLSETIGQNLKKTTQKFPEETALVSISQQYRATYAEFWNQTTQLAKNLVSFGMKKGDRVRLWSPNCYEWVLIQYATARIGAIMVSINTAYRGEELKFALNQSGCRYLFASKGDKYASYKEIIESIKTDCSELTAISYFDEDFSQFLSENKQISDEELAYIESETNVDDPINIQYTSGTTGFPKGVTLSHKNILNNGYFIGER